MTGLPPSPFISSAGVAEHLPVETLPAESSGGDHHSAGSRFSIDEEAFLYAIDPPPLFISDPSPAFLAGEIEPLLKTLFYRGA